MRGPTIIVAFIVLALTLIILPENYLTKEGADNVSQWSDDLGNSVSETNHISFAINNKVVWSADGEAHDPIYINNNLDFRSPNNGVRNWNDPNAGTGNNPFIIEDWLINASSVTVGSAGIHIGNTDDHFVVKNCSIFDGGINYNAIFLSNIRNGKIENSETINNKHGIYIDVSSDIIMMKNTVLNNSGFGIALFDSNNNRISENHIDNASDNGIHLWENCYDINISKNEISNTHHGIGIFWCNSTNNILDNKLWNNYQGIGLHGSMDHVLKNNEMSGNDYNFGVFGGGLDTLSTYYHDIDTSNTVDGKPVYYWVEQENRSAPDDAGYFGAINSTNITVGDLTFTNNTDGILFAFTKNINIENVTVNNNYNGINLVSSINNVVINSVIKSNIYGIKIGDFEGGENFIISNNIIHVNAIGIIGYDSNNISFSNNSIKLNNVGINMQGCNHVYSSSNTINSNKDTGIYFYRSGNGTFIDNTITSNRAGISLIVSSGTIENNTVDSNDISGIYVKGSKNVTISHNFVRSNNESGIFLEHLANNNKIENNIINSNGKHGIYLFERCDDNLIRNNTLEKNYNGTFLLYLCNNNTIVNNTLKSNDNYGIWLSGSSNTTVFYNSITESKTGIYLNRDYFNGYASENCKIQYNNIYDNLEFGVNASENDEEVNGINNWWGAANGPSGEGSGDGDPVSENVDYDPWVTVPVIFNKDPSISIVEPDGVNDTADTSFTIRWNASDPDEGDILTVWIHWDVDQDPSEMTQIGGDHPAIGEHEWDTSDIPEGEYYIYAEVDDGNGSTDNTYSDGPVTITHPESGENTAPTVSVETPANGTSVSGTIWINGSAQDADGNDDIVSVQIKVGGRNWKDTDGVMEWSYSWDTTREDNGEITIVVKVEDSDGATGSEKVTVNVDNFIPEPPWVEIHWPSDGLTVSGMFNITGTAGGDVEIESVTVEVDDDDIAVIGTSDWSAGWDSTIILYENITIIATVEDADGRTNSTSITITVDNRPEVVNEPPTISFVDGPTVVKEGRYAVFVIEVEDPDGLDDITTVFGDLRDLKGNTVLEIPGDDLSRTQGTVQVSIDTGGLEGYYVLHIFVVDSREGGDFDTWTFEVKPGKDGDDDENDSWTVFIILFFIVLGAVILLLITRKRDRTKTDEPLVGQMVPPPPPGQVMPPPPEQVLPPLPTQLPPPPADWNTYRPAAQEEVIEVEPIDVEVME